MPAFVNSNVGSSAGRRGDERTRVCPCSSKYFKNASRISLPVIINSSLPHIRIIHVISGQRPNLATNEFKSKALPQQMIEQTLGFGAVFWSSTNSQTLRDRLVDQLLFRSLSVDRVESLIRDICSYFLQLKIAFESSASHRPLFYFEGCITK